MKKDIFSLMFIFLNRIDLRVQKRMLSFLILQSFIVSLPAQINFLNNVFRSGDQLIKQQVEYKDPGRTGENVLWNFEKLEEINSEYTLTYSAPSLLGDTLYILGLDSFPAQTIRNGELIIGTEHYTRYYYQARNDSLLLLGYENPTSVVHHTQPVLLTTYPLSYQKSIHGSFSSEGFYSGGIALKSEGDINIQADAVGKMLLPSGDTLCNVMRIKSEQFFHNRDTISADSMERQRVSMLENCKWYAKGYRYPVFETFRSFNSADSLNTPSFSTAFFYPPQEHFYLNNDEYNLAVLDSLWNNGISPAVNDPGETSVDRTSILSYNYYPNPVRDYIYVDYYLEEAAKLSIGIYDISGLKKISIPEQYYEPGAYSIKFNVGILPIGNYILKLILKGEVASSPIIKL